jgi:HlyD family secretion protein
MRPVHLSATVLIAIAIPVFGILAIPVLNGSLHASTAEAQSKVEELIDRLRHGAMPEGIAKSSGRVEATQIDVAANTPVGWRR